MSRGALILGLSGRMNSAVHSPPSSIIADAMMEVLDMKTFLFSLLSDTKL